MKPAPAPRTFLQGDGLKIWTNPGASPNIVIFCRGILYLSNIAEKDLKQAVDRLSAGAGPEQVFGTYMREIPLIAIELAEADMRHNRFRFRYHSGLGLAHDEVELAHSHAAEELRSVLHQQLGDGYAVSKISFNPLRLCMIPFAILLIHVMLCGMAWLMIHPPDGHRHRETPLIRWLQDSVGDRGLQLFATTIGTILLIWMLTRLLTRPIGTTFRRLKESLQ